MTFTPKFVDLVRNFATVQGSGQVTLGAPVHGYTGIADALQPGEQFYYNLQGVDKPHEREIGRGTLEANGKVAREAISGSLTPFSAGTKTIALVAAAEWFSKLESGGGAGGGQSASVSPQDFGAVGDGVTDDGLAFVAAIAHLNAGAANDSGTYKGSGRLFVPAGSYYLGTTTLDITHTFKIEGEGSGMPGGIATKLKWAAGVTGIRVQRYNTEGAGDISSPTHAGGDASQIKGLYLEGGYAGTEGEYHGIHLKARALIEDCFLAAWQGDGIHIESISSGNANCFEVNRCRVQTVRNGLFVDGSDANAGVVTLLDVTNCRRWGIWDSSFLGNTYVACHAAGCGWIAGSVPTAVTHSGNRYYVKAGQEAGASTNAPTGTTADNTWWGWFSAGGVTTGVPAWVSGTTYRTGGAYHTDNSNATSVFLGCYSEGGQGPSQINPATMVIHGQHGAGVYGTVKFDHGYAMPTANVGPKSGGAANGFLYINSNVSGQGSELVFRNYQSGTPVVSASIMATSSGSGGWLYYDAKAGKHIFRLNGVQVAELASGGLNLATGNGVRVNGTQVVGARGAAVADATDAATAITQLNALLARMRAHGLIAA